MQREDYLMRLIRQFVDALARMMKLRTGGDLIGAREQADQLYESLGIPRALCDVVDSATLAGMLRTPDQIRAAARLSWEDGHLLRAGGDPLAAHRAYKRAHELFLEARALAPEPDDDGAILELSRQVDARFLDERYQDPDAVG
jgi:hypothetical protein